MSDNEPSAPVLDRYRARAPGGGCLRVIGQQLVAGRYALRRRMKSKTSP